MSDSTVTIPLTQGQVTIIDAVDADLAQFKWNASKRPHGYYATRRAFNERGERKYIPLHRVILERKLGRPLMKWEEPDHVNLDKLDNRRENLRPATKRLNAMNRRRSAANTSGYKGVSQWKDSNKWRASIKVNGKLKHLGTFDTAEQAHEAYCKVAKEVANEFARFE